MRKTLCILGLLIASSTACGGDPPPDQGYVRDKEFKPAHWEGGWDTYYTTEYRCHTESEYDYNTGQTRYVEDCGPEQVSHTVWDDHDEWVEDRWRLKLEDCQSDKDGKEKCRSGWKWVTENEYEDYRLGQHYPDAA